jgi:hypothetical protein
MRDFDSLLSINVGGAACQLADYSYFSEPLVKEGKGRTGTHVRLEGEGWIEAGQDSSAFGTRLLEAVASFSVSGQNIIIQEWGGPVKLELLAAQCVEGGPHITFTLDRNLDGVGLVKKFRFSADAEQKLNTDDPNEPSNTFTATTTTGPDGLRTVEINGEVTGSNAMSHFTTKVLDQFASQYPHAKWVRNHQAGVNLAGDKVTYTVTFAELLNPYPAALPSEAVDGEASIRMERDEQFKLVRIFRFDLVVTGDPQTVYDAIRPAPASLVRETSEITRHKVQRIQAEFTTMADGNGDGLLYFEQSFSMGLSFSTVAAVQYPGLKPFLVYNPPNPCKYAQTGRAIGYGKFPKAPDPLLGNLASTPIVVNRHIDAFQKETTWQYEFLAVDPASVDLTKLARPSK